MNETTENKIVNKIKKCGRGSVFFINDFISYGNRNAVNKSLERLANKEFVIRVARGIYCYPKIEKMYGLGIIPPTFEDIATAIAKKDGAKIIPTGLYAQYQLELTQQIPMTIEYLTNGVSRTIHLSENRSIKFKHASPRYFAIKNQLAVLITTALKEWKVENLSDEQIAMLKTKVNASPRIPNSDLKLMTVKVRELILDLYE